MKVYLIKDSDLRALRRDLLDRAVLLPMIDRAIPALSVEQRDELVTNIERRIGLVVNEWTSAVSE